MKEETRKNYIDYINAKRREQFEKFDVDKEFNDLFEGLKEQPEEDIVEKTLWEVVERYRAMLSPEEEEILFGTRKRQI